VQRTVIYCKYGYYVEIFRCAAPTFAISIFLSTNIKGALHQERLRLVHLPMQFQSSFLQILKVLCTKNDSDWCSAPLIFVETSKCRNPKVQRTVMYCKYGYYVEIFRCAAPTFAISIFLSTNIKGALHQERLRLVQRTFDICRNI